MKAKARHWVKYNGAWHRAGESFVIDAKDAEEMKHFAEVTDGGPDVTEDAEEETAAEEAPVRRGRKRRTEE